ncbi:MAG: hypothetical protein U0792_05360 [Gemmataceae bacterium]
MNPRLLLVVMALLALVAGVAAQKAEAKKGVFASLEVGQQVSLKETASGYTIGVMPGIPLAHKVIEVGSDYIVLEDPAGVTQTRIPITSVKAVTVTKLPKDK